MTTRACLVSAASSLAFAAILITPAAAAAPKGKMALPDFTKGDAVPAGATHDWTLGATGARGWMFSDKLVTTDARQVAVTKVEKGSPADGALKVGDVILGVGGKPFSYDPRTEFMAFSFKMTDCLLLQEKAFWARQIGGFPLGCG